MKTIRAVASAVFTIVLAGCATTGGKGAERRSDAVGGAVSQPFVDLGLVRGTLPEILTKASASPYGLGEPIDCAVIASEVLALDAALGPDPGVAPADKSGLVSDMALDALRGAVGLPFRGVVRRISGAERRDRERAAAVVAGMVRRGYLKGVLRGAHCAAVAEQP